MKKLAVFLLLLTIFSCTEEDAPYIITCSDGIVPIENFPGNFEDAFKFRNDIDSMEQRKFVIQSDTEWESYVTSIYGTGLPSVDFSKKTVIIGRLYHSIKSSITKQEIVSDCGKKEIYYKISLLEGSAADTGNAYFYAIIPKISEDTRVKIQPTYGN